MRKLCFVLLMLSMATQLVLAQSGCSSAERMVATRSSLLTGEVNSPSKAGQYMVTFPPPNECVTLGPIKAGSRVQALYLAMSKGGFSLTPSEFGLSVWTIEEWNDFAKADPAFDQQLKEHCKGSLAQH